MNWLRITAIVTIVAACIGGVLAIWHWDQAPRWAYAVSGVLMIPIAIVAAALAILAWYFVSEVLRPSIRFRKPLVPLALATREAALAGRSRYRMHPVTFWGVLTCGNRFAFGFMLFGKIHHITFDDKDSHS